MSVSIKIVCNLYSKTIYMQMAGKCRDGQMDDAGSSVCNLMQSLSLGFDLFLGKKIACAFVYIDILLIS